MKMIKNFFKSILIIGTAIILTFFGLLIKHIGAYGELATNLYLKDVAAEMKQEPTEAPTDKNDGTSDWLLGNPEDYKTPIYYPYGFADSNPETISSEDLESRYHSDDDTYNDNNEDVVNPDLQKAGMTAEEANEVEELVLPDVYYHYDYSSFQPYMDVDTITAEGTPSYEVTHSWRTYVDEYGLLRSIPDEDQFNLGMDDYVVALGTFYKEKGTAGSRYLITTTTGQFTVIAGDEKDDNHTEAMNMGTLHEDSEGNISLAIIEWIVDEESLDEDIATYGTVTAGPIEALKGEITGIYLLDK